MKSKNEKRFTVESGGRARIQIVDEAELTHSPSCLQPCSLAGLLQRWRRLQYQV